MKWRTVLFVLIAGLAAAMASAQTPMTDSQSQPLTITGTVVSNTGGQLVIDTDSGRKTFTTDTSSAPLPTGLAVGDRVSVQYHDMGAGQMHLASASLVESSAATAAQAPATPTYAEPALPRTSATTAAPTTNAPDMTAQSSDTSASAEPERKMPRTASSVPLVGLIGVLALAGGLAVRYTH
jgi:hypothetical protein